MDQGVIQNFKVQYRKHVLHSICGNMGGNCNSVTELSTKISVLDAVRGYLMQKKKTPIVCRIVFKRRVSFSKMRKR
jgi:hypothetical protein